MTTLQLLTQYAGAVLALVTALLLWVTSGRRSSLPWWACLVTAVVLTVSCVSRWVLTGHPPLFGTFENTLMSATVLAWYLLGLGTMRSEPHRDLDLPLLSTWIPVTLVYGLFFQKTILPLTISERSLWIDVHVSLAWAAYAVLLHLSMKALAVLLGRGSEQADRELLQGAGIGFVLFSGMMAVGSFYSYQLFASWFKWEMVETVAAAAWLGYASVLHVSLMLGWRGKRRAGAILAVLPLLLLSFWVWSLYSGTYHFFDINILRAR